MVLQLSPVFPPMPTSNQPPSLRESPLHCSCPCVIHICSLANLFTFLHLVPPPMSPLTAVSLFCLSMPLFLFW